jgi:hypothetical protein
MNYRTYGGLVFSALKTAISAAVLSAFVIGGALASDGPQPASGPSGQMAQSRPAGGSWTRAGGDSGMTKYSPDNIGAGPLRLDYQKRFYSKWSNDTSPAYNFSAGVLIKDGQAFVMSNDAPDDKNMYSAIQATMFDWRTGKTTSKSALPGYGTKTSPKSFHANQNIREIDSHHYNFPALWHSDGRIYARRGGDHRCLGAMDVATGTWTMLPADGAAQKAGWAGDSSAFINSYEDKILYFGGDTRDNWPCGACDISPAAWAKGDQGTYLFGVGPSSPFKSAAGENWYRHGDIPKAAANMVVLAGWCTDEKNAKVMVLEATDLGTGKQAWVNQHPNTTPGATGFFTCTADYWRFVATQDGNFAYFVRTDAESRLHVVDIKTGQDKVNRALAGAKEHPIMAYHDNFLYVIGATEQMKINAGNGTVAWRQTHAFPGDDGYRLSMDPLYRPMVLTDDSLWFVDGSAAGQGKLVGLRTSDGQIIQTIDLAKMVSADKPNLKLLAVNDLVSANGLLGVFVDIADTQDTNTFPSPTAAQMTGNGVVYQDLYVFKFGESATTGAGASR